MTNQVLILHFFFVVVVFEDDQPSINTLHFFFVLGPFCCHGRWPKVPSGYTSTRCSTFISPLSFPWCCSFINELSDKRRVSVRRREEEEEEEKKLAYEKIPSRVEEDEK